MLYIYNKEFWNHTLHSTFREEGDELSKYCTVSSFENLINLKDKFKIVMVEGTFIPVSNKISGRFVKEFRKKLSEASTRILLLEDVHEYGYRGSGIKGLATFIYETQFDGIACRYLQNPEVGTLRGFLDDLGWKGKFHWMPHSIPSDFSTLPKHEKIYDILLFGAMLREHYPFRSRLYRILSTMKNLRIKLMLKSGHIPQQSGDIFGSALIEKLSKSRLIIATKSKYDYLVRKYFEVSAAGSVVLGNMATDGEEIWGDNYVHIDESMTDGEIKAIIQKALSDKEDLEEKSQRMEDKIFSEHTTEIRVQDLLKFIENLTIES